MKALAAVTIVAVLAVPLAAQNPADQATGAPAPAAPAQTPAAQTPAAPPAEQGGSVFRSGASLVALNVTVSDGKRLVPGLKQDDFAVYEDGVLQHVQFFEAREVPIDLILLIDTSASMADKMDVVRDAAAGFLATLRDRDRGAVVTFGDRVNIVQPLTDDRKVLERAVRGAQASGSTALNNALYVALKQFARSAQQTGDVRRQAIAMLSDGEDTSSVIGFDDVLGDGAEERNQHLYDLSAEPVRGRPRRVGAAVLLGVRLRDEIAGAGDRRGVVLPAFDPGPAGNLCRHLGRTGEPVFDRLCALEFAPRRPLPQDHHQGERPPGIPSTGADGVYRREHDLERGHPAAGTVTTGS